MTYRLNPNVGRRDLLGVFAAGAGAAAIGVAPVVATAQQTTDPGNKKGKARYRADAPEVQTFYRVNSYPAKK